MDNYLRIALLLLGLVIVAVIVWDGYRKKRLADVKSDEFNQDSLDDMMASRDSGGYDFTGVGLTRILGDEFSNDLSVENRDSDNTVYDESMVASRDDDFISDESFNDDVQSPPADDKINRSQNGIEQTIPDLIITMSLIARAENGFVGEKLLHCMLSRGLRFGKMDIFHRHKNTSGEGPVQFSLANALNPGTFDLDDMGSFQTKAITMFLILPGPKEPLKAYQMMLETAQYLAKELDGQLVDSTKSVLTQQTIQHFNEQIQEFERKALSSQQTQA
ncbi:MAG: FtsZ-interacting cell division protein ZipA [Enterobacterales bacterium]|jgi:FtsZ-interacting cell division protein ZipA